MTASRAAGRRGLPAGVASALALTMILGGPITAVLARLSDSQSVGANTVTAGRIFSGARTTTAWTIGDASSGTASNKSDVLSYADSQAKTTGAWAAVFASTRYFELALQPVLAAEVAISSASFNFGFRPSTSTSTACFYFDVRTASTSAVLATYGSSAAPVGCNSTTTLSIVSTPIPILTSTTQANDLAVRVYMNNSGTTRTAIIDLATVTGTTGTQAFTLFEKRSVDASTGTPATTAWSFSTNDTTVYTSAANWTTAFVGARYLSFTFPAYLPSTASVSAASLSRAYRTSSPSDTVCWYMDVLNGASLLATHGSSATPISCSSSNSTFTTDTVPLPEVSTAAIANNTVVKLYNRSSATNKSVDTLVSLSVTWQLP